MIAHRRFVVATGPELGMAFRGPEREREIDTALEAEARQCEKRLACSIVMGDANLVHHRTGAYRVLEKESCWKQRIVHCSLRSDQSQSQLRH